MEDRRDTPMTVPSGTIHRTIGLLHGALQGFGLDPDAAAVEKIGVMVNRAMSAQQRSFHTPEHIFDLTDPRDPHITLAALFHDLVYFQVDKGFSEDIGDLLEPYIAIDADGVSLRKDIPEADRSFAGCAAVFGFAPGDRLSPFGGLNEFLSALVMDILLEGTVSDENLLIATACIEATIPFRPPTEDGRRPPQLLEERLKRTNEQFRLGLSPRQVEEAVIAAVCFANRDVQNFSEEDVARFLDNTWKLLPESNPALRLRGLFTIGNYAVALLKMHGFLRMLRAETVFHHFNGYPDDGEYRRLLELTTRNLTIGHRYLGIKLISAGILHALAQLSGGDAPVAFFMGDINAADSRSELAGHLPQKPGDCGRSDDESDDLYRLLAYGRASESRFDLQHSPLSLFVYQCLTDEQLDTAITAAKEMFEDARTPEAFLSDLPGDIVRDIARAAAQLAFTRRDTLMNLADRFGA
jgi:hypothetical protein